MRMIQIQDNISEQKNLKDKLESEQEKLHMEYNKVNIPIQRTNKWTMCVHRLVYQSANKIRRQGLILKQLYK